MTSPVLTGVLVGGICLALGFGLGSANQYDADTDVLNRGIIVAEKAQQIARVAVDKAIQFRDELDACRAEHTL
jgi:hypothetical protein